MSPVNSLIATATELLNSCSDVTNAPMYSGSVVIQYLLHRRSVLNAVSLTSTAFTRLVTRSAQHSGLVYNQRFVSSVRPSR